jgi:hypothetical protein
VLRDERWKWWAVMGGCEKGQEMRDEDGGLCCGGCEKSQEIRDEDWGLWWGAVRKVERWRWGAVRTVERCEKGWEMRDEDGACAEDEDWETWARKVESENGG